MNAVAISLPLWAWAATLLLMLTGLGFIIWRLVSVVRFIITVRSRLGANNQHAQAINEGFTQSPDEQAKAAIDKKIKQTWRSFTQTRLLDLEGIRDECITLTRDVAACYFPDSDQPEYEVTLFELLQLSEHIHRELIYLLSPWKPFQQITVKHLLRTRELYQRSQKVVNPRHIQTGRRIADWGWMALNSLNPAYWASRAAFMGASELTGRQVLASLFRIVGAEAMKTYRSSHALSGKKATDAQINDFVAAPFDAEALSNDNPLDASTPSFENAPELSSIETEADVNRTDQPGEPQEGLYQQISSKLSLFLEGSMQLWEKLSHPDTVIREYANHGCELEQLSDIESLPIETIDEVADRFVSKGAWLSAAEGAVTGAGGFLMMGVDAASLIALQLRTIQQIGYSYGYDVTAPEEKLFAVKLLVEGYKHPLRGDRATLLNEMRNAARMIKGDTPIGLLQQRMLIQGVSKAAQTIGIRIGGRKTAQIFPVIGAAAGGYINKKVTHEIALAAKAVYRDRRLSTSEERETGSGV